MFIHVIPYIGNPKKSPKTVTRRKSDFSKVKIQKSVVFYIYYQLQIQIPKCSCSSIKNNLLINLIKVLRAPKSTVEGQYLVKVFLFYHHMAEGIIYWRKQEKWKYGANISSFLSDLVVLVTFLIAMTKYLTEQLLKGRIYFD